MSRAFLIKQRDGRGDYYTIMGVREDSLTVISTERGRSRVGNPLDRRLKEGDVKVLLLAATGIFTSKIPAVNFGEEHPLEISYQSGERFRANFRFNELRLKGVVHDEGIYHISLESVGEIQHIS